MSNSGPATSLIGTFDLRGQQKGSLNSLLTYLFTTGGSNWHVSRVKRGSEDHFDVCCAMGYTAVYMQLLICALLPACAVTPDVPLCTAMLTHLEAGAAAMILASDCAAAVRPLATGHSSSCTSADTPPGGTTQVLRIRLLSVSPATFLCKLSLLSVTQGAKCLAWTASMHRLEGCATIRSVHGQGVRTHTAHALFSNSTSARHGGSPLDLCTTRSTSAAICVSSCWVTRGPRLCATPGCITNRW
jgi:hypothetical protein